MKRSVWIWAAGMFLTCFSTANAELEADINTAAELNRSANAKLLLCELEFRHQQLLIEAAQLRLELPSGQTPSATAVSTCVREAIAATRPRLDKLGSALKKKPAALAALRSYYASWVTTIREVEPLEAETKIQYAARQRDNKRKTEDAWNRFELE